MTLDELVANARAAWPAWPGEDAAGFARFVADLQAEAEQPLESLRASDLWLAYHAGIGVAPAVAALDATCFADLTNLLRARRADPAEADETVQRLRHRLLVAGPGERSRILTYAGRGELRAWIRIAAVRAWLNLKRETTGASDVSAEDAFVDEATTDLELELLKGKYREHFRRAFLEAVLALDPSTRLLLKLHYLDRLSMEEVGKVLGVHRLTVLRRLDRAREELSSATKERLQIALKLAAPDVESLLRFIQSRLDVSVRQAFAESSGDAG